MRHTISLALSVALLLSGCQPKNEEVQRDQVNPKELEAVTDSATNTGKDGTATTHTFNEPEFILPQPVMQYLSEHYTGWKKPALGTGTEKQAEAKQQGPFIVKGDFNGDGKQDQVLQFQLKGDVVILALWEQEDGKLAAQKLEENKLSDLGGEPSSLYILSLTEAGTWLRHLKTGDVIDAPHEAVSVALPGKTTIYAWDGTTFSAYTSAATN